MLLGADKGSQEIKKSYGPKGAEGDFVVFYPVPHHYYLNDDKSLRLISVTTLLHKCFPEFETETVAKKVAAKRKVDWQDLVAEWKREGEFASELGTAVHFYAETILKANDLNAVMEEDVPEAHRPFLRALKSYIPKLWEKLEFVEAEKIIFSKKYGVSGTIDLLMRSKKTGNLVILDWKSNKKITFENRWERGLGFLKHLDNCNYNHYSLQLNVYKQILLEEGYCESGKDVDLALIHLLREENGEVTPKLIQAKRLECESKIILENHVSQLCDSTQKEAI